MLEEGAEGMEADAVRTMELNEDAISKGGGGAVMRNLDRLLRDGENGLDRNWQRGSGAI